jgi:hypothetical protein
MVKPRRKAECNALQAWLKTLPCAEPKWRSCFSSLASGADVAALNEALEVWKTENSSSKLISMPLDANLLFRVSGHFHVSS